jgi:hypothetical protein
MVWIGVDAEGKGEGRDPGEEDLMKHDEQFGNPLLQI